MKSVPAVLLPGKMSRTRASREILQSPIPRRARISGHCQPRAVGNQRETAPLLNQVVGTWEWPLVVTAVLTGKCKRGQTPQRRASWLKLRELIVASVWLQLSQPLV